MFSKEKFPNVPKKQLSLQFSRKETRPFLQVIDQFLYYNWWAKLLQDPFTYAFWAISKKFLLSPSQNGLKEGRSTQDAFIDLTDKVYDALNSKEFSISVFINF